MKILRAIAVTIIIVLTTFTIAFAVVKVNVCHRTGSPSNPYVLIVVSVQSVEDAINLGGHGHHADDAWQSYEFEGVTYPSRNEDVFGSLIDDSCNLIAPPTSTNTPVTPTYTPTSTPDEPTSTPTNTPTNDPRTPTATSTPTNDPRTPTAVVNTATPYPPKASVSKSITDYEGEYIGEMIIGSRDFKVYEGVNAPDGSLLLPNKVRGASLYRNTLWMHREWKSGVLILDIGQRINIFGKSYLVSSEKNIDYGVYPPNGKGIQYIATCYREKGKWAGIVIYGLTPVRTGE